MLEFFRLNFFFCGIFKISRTLLKCTLEDEKNIVTHLSFYIVPCQIPFESNNQASFEVAFLLKKIQIGTDKSIICYDARARKLCELK